MEKKSEHAKLESRVGRCRETQAKAELRLEEFSNPEVGSPPSDRAEPDQQGVDSGEEHLPHSGSGTRSRSAGRNSLGRDEKSRLEAKLVDATTSLTAAELVLADCWDEITSLEEEVTKNERRDYGWYAGDPFALPAHPVGEDDRERVSEHLASFRIQCSTMAAVIETSLSEDLKIAMKAIPLYRHAKEHARVDVMVNCIMTMVGNSSYANAEPNAMNIPILEGLEELGKMRQGGKELNLFFEEFSVCVTRLSEKGLDIQNPTTDVMLGLMLIRACSTPSNQRGRDDATDDKNLQFPTCTRSWAEDKLRTWADRARELARNRNFSGARVEANVAAAAAVPTAANPKEPKGKKKGGKGGKGSGAKGQTKFCDLHKTCDHHTFNCTELSQAYRDKAKETWEALKAERARLSK